MFRRRTALISLAMAMAVGACTSAGPPTWTFPPAGAATPTSAASNAAPTATPSAEAPNPSAPPSAPASSPSASPSGGEPSPSAAPSGGESSPSASPSGGESASLSEWAVITAGAQRAGKTTFTISNNGSVPHELLVFKSSRDPAAYPTDAAGNIIEDGAGVDLVSDGDNIDPGGSQVRQIDLVPGKYLFVCNIPGHFKQGMYAVVFVTP
jgi:hypothetical protein